MPTCLRLVAIASAILFQSNSRLLAQAPRPAIAKVESNNLPNLIKVNSLVFSGGLPEGDQAFKSLSELGVRTIISVDGAKPNVELAAKYSMQYVHLPHGYDGISVLRSKELAKALTVLDGPFYIHCHHGKHRSPAAAAVACVGLGWISSDQATQFLKLAGTDVKYKGLFRSVENARPITKSVLAELDVKFVSVAELPAMAQSMVEIEELFERLKTAESSSNSVSHGNKDESTSLHQTAVLLNEHFRELMRMQDRRCELDSFKTTCQASEQAAARIEQLLSDGELAQSSQAAMAEQLRLIENNCKACHQEVRN